MTLFLFDENLPAKAVVAARAAGLDVASVTETMLGSEDSQVLAHGLIADRVLVTFDKDFGDLTFRDGAAAAGVVLLRPRAEISDLEDWIVHVLLSRDDWHGRFSVVSPTRIRSRALST